MLLTEILFALLTAGILTGVFSGFRRIGPWRGVWIFFVVVFLGAWLGALWLQPIGPAFYGVHWLPLLFIGIIFALLLAATSPPPPRRPLRERVAEQELAASDPAGEMAMTVVAVSWFLWVLLIGLVLAVVLGYLYRQNAAV